jgi:beta-lactamase superfamily II metal-dependent hydrolase
MITRRHFAFGIFAFAQSLRSPAESPQPGESGARPGANVTGASLSPWSPGMLDIHHIDTGRGNSTFILAPDGTTILIDCGASNDSLEESAPYRPNNARLPGEWVARYALRRAAAANRNSLDYLIVTHIHPDHVGDIPAGTSEIPGASFIATGVSQVDKLMPATKVIDRGYPHYEALKPPNAPFAKNYLDWLSARQAAGRAVEPLQVGSSNQIVLQSQSPRPSSHPTFTIRSIAGNGRVWNHPGTGSRPIIPNRATPGANMQPDENSCSIALRLDYGAFSYFTGGDLACSSHDGRSPWLDVETPAVEACGRVEVAVADHHGYYDACGPAFTRSLDAQAYVIPAWHATHPGQAQLERLLGAWPGETIHDVFSTELLPANRLFNSRWANQLRSTQGHVVVRVEPGGSHYRIFAVDSTQEDGPISFASNLYHSRS